MKKIFIAILLAISIKGASQPVVGRSGSANTVMDSRWMAQYNMFVPRYADTVSANLQKGIDTCGALIFTYDYNGFWYRQCSPKKWVQIFANSPSPSSDTLVWKLSGNAVATRTAAPVLGTTTADNLNFITDNQQRMIIPSAGITRNTAAVNKYLLLDTVTKNLYYGDGGSSSTPTWQQTLTAGSTLTTDNTIDIEGNELIFSNGGTIELSTVNGVTSSTIIESTGSSIVLQASGSAANYNSVININTDSIKLFPHLGRLSIDTLLNRSNQNALMGWDSTGTDRGQVGYVTLGSGLSLSSGVLNTSGTVPTPISSLTAATGTNSIDVSSTQTWTGNSITTGTQFTHSTNSLTSGNLINLVSTSTALASGSEILNIGVSGANSTNGITATGARISVTNTNATSGTNIGVEVTASGATTQNYATYSSASGTAGSKYAVYGAATGTGTVNYGSYYVGSGATTNYGVYTQSSGGTTNYGVQSIAIGTTGATNIAGYFDAHDGAVANYAIIVPSGSGNVGIGTSSPSASALLDVSSTTKGVLIPRMTTTERNAISTPSVGLMIYNTTDSAFNYYRLSGWTAIGGGGSTSPGGSDTYIQFNDGGSFGGDAGFTYNKTTNVFSTNNGAYRPTGTISFSDAGAGSVYKSSSDGLVLRAVTGSGYDLLMYDAVGNGVFGIEAGTSKLGSTSQIGAGLLGYGSWNAWMNLRGGTTTNASLTIRDGVAPSSPAEGQIWRTTDKVYNVIQTGAATKEFTLNDIALTSGRIPYTTTNGRLTDVSTFVVNSGNVGIGTGSPSALLHVMSTTEQLRVGYDASNYFSTTVGSAGAVAIAATGSSSSFNFSNRLSQKQGADVASASTIALGYDGNTFEITGTTNIELITKTGWQNGSIINLVFSDVLTVTNGVASSGNDITIILAGASHFETTADDVLTLMLCKVGGTQKWVEVSRSVN